MNRQEAIQAYADWMIENELNHYRKYQPDRLATVTDEQMTAFRGGWLIKAGDVAATFDDKRAFWKSMNDGRYHPDNRASRRLFTAITGIDLPKTNAGTREVLRAFIGEESALAFEEEVRLAKEAREAEHVAKEAAKRDAYLSTIKAKFLAGGGVNGDELVDLARSLGIEIHPRSVGMLRKRVVWICEDKARIYKGGPIDSAYELYKEVKEAMAEQQAAFT